MAMNQSIRILVVDDDHDFNETVTDFLQGNGFEVTIAEVGVAGLRAVMATDFDVLLVDMVMPNLPGDGFYHAVQRIRPGLCSKIIFVTGHMRNPNVSGFLETVHLPILTKPFKFDALLEIIRTTTGKAGDLASSATA